MSVLTVERVRQIARGAADHAVMLAESGDFDAHVDWVKTLAEAWLLQADALAAAETREAGLREALEREKHVHHGTLVARDAYHEAADRLAYALFDIEEIGEHSSANDPWDNAAEVLESSRDVLVTALASAPATQGEGL